MKVNMNKLCSFIGYFVMFKTMVPRAQVDHGMGPGLQNNNGITVLWVDAIEKSAHQHLYLISFDCGKQSHFLHIRYRWLTLDNSSMAPMNQTEILSAFPTESSSQSKRGRFDSCKTQHFSVRLVKHPWIVSSYKQVWDFLNASPSIIYHYIYIFHILSLPNKSCVW